MTKKSSLIIAGIFVFGAVIFITAYFSLFAPVGTSIEEVDFRVSRGKGISQIAADLKASGLVRSSLGAHLAIRVSGVRVIQAGGYTLSQNMDAWEIARTLGQSTADLNVTIPEGYRVDQVAKAFVDAGIIASESEFIAKTKAHASLPRPLAFLQERQDLEGYLFPDTYNLFPNTPSEDVIAILLDNFVSRIDNLEGRIASSGKTLDEIVILASLIEKEAKTDIDRKMIAGVLANRISSGMRLDVDASTRYAVRNFDQPLTRTQLDNQSPYNTRVHAGLPPGPICNPGLAAIEAVLSPTPNDYLYYLTGNDGQTYYAKTLDEHNVNKAKYLS